MKFARLAAGASVTALALLTAACGGGGGGPPVSTPAPTPAPSPGPTPTPSPTPSPPVATIDDPVVEDTTFSTLNGGYADGTNFVGKWNEGLKLRYNIADDTITATTRSGAEFEFETTASEPGHPFPDSATYRLTDPIDNSEIRLGFSRPSINGVKMTYLTWGTWLNMRPESGDSASGSFITGIPTPIVPNNGTATYETYIGASSQVSSDPLHALVADKNYSLTGNSSATLGIDFGSGIVSTTLNLAGVAYVEGTPDLDPSDTIDYGRYVGSGELQSGGPAFEGTFAGADGSFSGALFGPDAAEAGYIFQIIEGDALLRGTVFGRKK